MISQTKPLKTKSFLPFNFPVTNICVAIRLAEMEQEWAAYSFNYPLVTLLSQSVNEFIHLFII